MKIIVFWDMTPCSLVDRYHCFICLPLQVTNLLKIKVAGSGTFLDLISVLCARRSMAGCSSILLAVYCGRKGGREGNVIKESHVIYDQLTLQCLSQST
jgi:hypothetical protein